MKKEFGKWLMDIAKYIVTAVIISSFFNGVQEELVYVLGAIIVVIIVVCGLYLQKEPIQKKKRRK
ncbi:hypothetical protein FACS189421_05980 [Bacteroidia bacterium]|nr:hypothetical protein FACS189421_05980 [Bacteroidia bacterium]GHT45837.1 hypothetical protein FACS189440_02620 [Bacteroidia bacterium]